MLSFLTLTLPDPLPVTRKPIPIVQTYKAQSHGRTIESRLHLSHLADVQMARLLMDTYAADAAA